MAEEFAALRFPERSVATALRVSAEHWSIAHDREHRRVELPLSHMVEYCDWLPGGFRKRESSC
jgi:hypothetical protein